MYKSLEHLIREIKEGKCCCDKKKDSLEGAIRKVVRKESSYAARDSKPVDEDDIKLPKDYGESIEEMNVVTNTGGQMLGRQYNTRSAIIQPRHDADDGHGQAAKNVSIQRRSKIEKFSAKNVSLGGKISEEEISEAPIKFKEPTKTDFKIAPVAKEPKLPTVVEPKLPTTGKEVEDLATKATELAVTATPMGRLASIARQILKPTPAGEKVSEFERQKQLGIQPKPAEVKPETKVEVKPEAKPETKVDTKTLPKVPEPVKTEVPTKTPEVKPEVKPVEEPKAAPKIPPVSSAPGSKMPAPSTTPGGKIKFPGIPYATAKPVELTGPHAPVSTSVSKHRGHRAVKNVYKEEVERKSIQDMPRKNAGDRHDIEFVGRKDADPKSAAEKTSRQAQYKIKVIDEAKKLADVVKKIRKESGDGKTKVYDNVVINPDLNRPDNKNDADLKP